MNSQQRVMAAVGHEPVDRVPVDFGAMRSTGIMAMAYNKLKKYLGFEHVPKTKVYDIIQQLAEPDMEVVDYCAVPGIGSKRVPTSRKSDGAGSQPL